MPDYDMPDKMFHRSEEAPEAAQSPEVSSGGTGISSGDSAAPAQDPDGENKIWTAVAWMLSKRRWVVQQQELSKWTVTHNGKSVTADTLTKAMVAAQSLRTDKEAQVAAENLLRAIDEELAQEAGQARELPKPDIRIDAFGDILPTDGRKFVMGDFYSAEQMRAALAQAAPAVPVGLDALREAVSDFRKATFEFAKGMDQDDHKRMMEAQKRIFDAAQANAPTVKREGDL